MTLEQQMKDWENWSKTVNTNINSNAGKVAIIENDFLTLVSDIKTVNTKTSTNAQKTKAISDDMEIVKNDLSFISVLNMGIESNERALGIVKEFIGVNHYSSLDAVLIALGYSKGTLSREQIASMGFLNLNTLHHYNFDNAKFNWWKGSKSLKEFATELGATLTNHNTRIKTWEDWNRLYERDAPGREAGLINVEGKVGGLESYTGRNRYGSLQEYIGSLGFVKVVGSVDGLLDQTDISNWGFITKEDFPNTNVSAALSGIKDSQDKDMSILKTFETIIGDLGTLDGKTVDRLTPSDLLDTILSDYTGTLTERLTALGGDLRKVPGMAECLRDKDSDFKGLIQSLVTELQNVTSSFDGIAQDFTAFPFAARQMIGKVDDALKKLHPPFGISAGTSLEVLLCEWKAVQSGGKSHFAEKGVDVWGNHDYNGVKKSFEGVGSNFKEITDKATELNTCGGNNLNW